jgi:hypothetical protein
MPKKIHDHKREDLPPAPGCEAFAELIFAFFDRVEWWTDRQQPWKRLSLMVTNSPPNVERWIRDGVMPQWEHFQALEHVIGIPAQDLYAARKYNRMPGALDTLSRDLATLHAAVDVIPSELVPHLLPIAQSLLAARQGDTRRTRTPRS